MKTVFLFLRQGISNRNLLRTDFLKTLKEHPEVRVVILSPIGEEPEFRREFESGNVCVEKWPRTKVGFWEKRLKNLKYYIWLSDRRNVTVRIKCRALHGPLGYLWRHLVGGFFSSLGVDQRRINRWELKIFKPHASITTLYDCYHPDLVLFTRMFGTNLHVIKEAKRRGVRVVCLVESWDNLTHKGPLSATPDRLVVWNEINRDEACKFHGFRAEDVIVGGVPQFDLYNNVDFFRSREEMFRELDVDPRRKLIMYATSTEGNSPEEMDTVQMLYEAAQRGEIKKPSHIIVRLHPISSPGLVARYVSCFEGKPGITLQRPGRPSKLHDGWDPTWSDMLQLARTVYHSDVLVNVASTIILDAAYLDTPIICVAFDGRKKKDYFKSCRRIYDFACFRHVVQSGGTRLCFAAEEMVHWINRYLESPDLDSDGRKRLKREQACFLDGRSAERIARIVLGELGLDQPELFERGKDFTRPWGAEAAGSAEGDSKDFVRSGRNLLSR